MERMFRFCINTLAVFVAVVLLGIPALRAGAQEARSVSVRETQLRESPGFLGRVITTLAYGDRGDSMQEQNGWTQARFGDSEGWVHTSALTTKRIVLDASDRDVQEAASSREVALAGRGFNRQVEAQYAAETGLDFQEIDRIEGYALDPEELLAFLQAGGLSLSEGGR
ncbi:MAG: SH3 domain-containing protein [Spirochaeta sp.]|nr:SH3 domain-containing protein [Spirochaeta sp.]